MFNLKYKYYKSSNQRKKQTESQKKYHMLWQTYIIFSAIFFCGMFSYWILSWIEPMTVSCDRSCLDISKVEKYIDHLAEKGESCNTARFNNSKLLGYCSYTVPNGESDECSEKNTCLPAKCIKFAKIFILTEKTTYGDCFNNRDSDRDRDIMTHKSFECSNKKMEKTQLIILVITFSSIFLLFVSLIISGCLHNNLGNNNIPENNYVIIENETIHI